MKSLTWEGAETLEILIPDDMEKISHNNNLLCWPTISIIEVDLQLNFRSQFVHFWRDSWDLVIRHHKWWIQSIFTWQRNLKTSKTRYLFIRDIADLFKSSNIRPISPQLQTTFQSWVILCSLISGLVLSSCEAESSAWLPGGRVLAGHYQHISYKVDLETAGSSISQSRTIGHVKWK